MAESWTHLDGVIGHFTIGSVGKADLSLLPDATQFIALEAKIFSGLSSGVKNAGYYDQAARNVACMAEVLRRAHRSPVDMAHLGFYVIAPQSQIKQGIFNSQMNRDSIRQKVERRVQAYEGAKDPWYGEWFLPMFEHIEVGLLSWEEVITTVDKYDTPSRESLRAFYQRCTEFNSFTPFRSGNSTHL